MAAARKVSPAAISTLPPLPFSSDAILPSVVVLPEPFTPTSSTTKGLTPLASGSKRPAWGASSLAIARARVSRISSSLGEAPKRSCEKASTIRALASTPRSAWISSSSNSSSASLSSGFLTKVETTWSVNWREDLVSPVVSRWNQPFLGSAGSVVVIGGHVARPSQRR